MPIPPISEQTETQSAKVDFESDARLHAYNFVQDAHSLVIHIYLSFSQSDFDGQGYSIHLIDPVNQESIASVDRYVDERQGLYMGPGYNPVRHQRAELSISAETPTNRMLWIALSLWRADGGEFLKQRILSSDHQLISDTQTVLGELVLPAVPVISLTESLAEFANGFKLDPVSIPQTAGAGEILTIPFTWRADLAGSEDYVQFVHIINKESGQWWTYDQQPLGPRLPTRHWYSGLVDTHIWEVALPATMPTARYAVFTGLYRISDKERLFVTKPDGTPFADARVPLAVLTIEDSG